MKKIKNIGQLKAEQQRLKEQQLELEDLIDDDWYEIKDSLRPKNITRQVFSANPAKANLYLSIWHHLLPLVLPVNSSIN